MVKKEKIKKIATLYDGSKVYDFKDSYLRIYTDGKIDYFLRFRLIEKRRLKYIDKVKGLVKIDNGTI